MEFVNSKSHFYLQVKKKTKTATPRTTHRASFAFFSFFNRTRKIGIILARHEKMPYLCIVKPNVEPTQKRKQTMKKKQIFELVAKIIVAALTAALTALTTTSCMGYGPIAF